MLRNILVPLDGSPLAEQALGLAAVIGRTTQARLHLFHVRSGGASSGEGPDPVQAYLAAARERVDHDPADGVSIAVADPDPQRGVPPDAATVAARIDEYARENAIDLVVMTTHGRGGISRFWFGSVADALVRTCALPLLLIRPDEDAQRAASRAAQPFSHLLMPLDGSEEAHAAVRPAGALAAAFGARVTLLRVIPLPYETLEGVLPLMAFSTDRPAEVREEAARDFAAVADALHSEGVDVATSTITDPGVAKSILRYATEHAVDLIVLATRSRSGFDRLMLGSIADKLVRAADCPVLVVRAPAAPDASGAAAHVQ